VNIQRTNKKKKSIQITALESIHNVADQIYKQDSKLHRSRKGQMIAWKRAFQVVQEVIQNPWGVFEESIEGLNHAMPPRKKKKVHPTPEEIMNDALAGIYKEPKQGQMKPSDRIMEIWRTMPITKTTPPLNNLIQAIVNYLDEQYEKESN